MGPGPLPILEPTPVGCALAALAVMGGAPAFAAGLRNLKLRRRLGRLVERSLAEAPDGFVLTRGRVALESPLVGPLSARPCVGFRLEVRAPHASPPAVLAAVEERRTFRLSAGGVSAAVIAPESASWSLPVTSERTISAAALTANLRALLERTPEASWLLQSPRPLVLVERALLAGEECRVVGSIRRARPYESEAAREIDLGEAHAEASEFARTGTDGSAAARLARRAPRQIPERRIEPDGALEFLHLWVGDQDPRALAPSVWRSLGVAIGPALGLMGLLYLARAADRFRELGF